ncbi:phenylalanine 4-monooxygenase [Pseudaminobacter sp. 19-2017]|uniref:Phenylalanine-4-hydroxylase n=1 Tax=Pseudaminobacter soli (ex Zhang et al. 2022) TaxID=2831468 RepID=A0A942DXF9_9HYPH|nr:phenylalanine 4-monooxygenase [Pseudaminobacter soli]MBS3649246.1 phenylalanine 4-monooxygenase [Pseudaminobacter soli]
MAAQLTAEQPKPRNRYKDAKRNPDWTIDQDWQSYSADEHERWDRLFSKTLKVLQGRACSEYLQAVKALQFSERGIPNMERLSDRLENITGWRIVPVTDLVPDDIFFDHLANRRFPAGAFIRSEQEMEYLEEPDIFHDIFGHVPMLANPLYADFIQAYGKGGQRALALGRLPNLARLYWYTVEFGLVKEDGDLRIFGAGIMSSTAESVFALDDPSPHRVVFDLERVMRTSYIIDDFQKIYFVLDSFEQLQRECYVDFGPLYERLATASTIEPHELIEGDGVLHRGTMAYFRNKKPKEAANA